MHRKQGWTESGQCRQSHMIRDLSASHTGLVLGEERRRNQHQNGAEVTSTSIEMQQHHFHRHDPRGRRRLLPDSGGSTAQDKPAPGSAPDASR